MNYNPRDHQNRGVTVWFTGLPCSGKTTISRLVFERLNRSGKKVELLDGDVVRQNLTKGLGFTTEDRNENIRRIGYVCRLLTRNGVVAISAAISPYRALREEVRGVIGSFLEIYVECPLDICIQRDIKGMYQRAISGELTHFTGVSDPYEEPLHPDLILHTNEETPEASARRVLALLAKSGYVQEGIGTCMSYDSGLLFEQISACLTENPCKSLADLSHSLQVSEHTIKKSVCLAAGKTFRSFREEILLMCVKSRFSVQPGTAIKEMCFGLGFKSASSFARAIKRASGLSPEDLRFAVAAGHVANAARIGESAQHLYDSAHH